MESALHSFFVSVPQAVAVWMILLLAVALAVALLAVPRKAPAPLLSEAERAELRFAADAALAAEKASANAARRRAEWAAARDELDAAWAAFERVDRRAREKSKAAAYPLLSKRRKPGENLDRQRYLHHAATVACRNRDLSIAQLNDIYAHRGWNPRLHPVVQEAVLHTAMRDHRYAEYLRLEEREREAWRAAEAAVEELAELRAAAASAFNLGGAGQHVRDERWFADQWATGELPAVA